MNAAQAGRLHRLIAEATHPERCPITGKRYTRQELADFGEASARVVGYEHGDSSVGELMEIRLGLPGLQRDPELFVDGDGELWVWSTVRIPAGDCPCECGTRLFRDSEPLPREQCPRHGDSVRELEVYRRVEMLGWEIVDEPHPLRDFVRREAVRAGDRIGGVDVPVAPPTIPSWRYVVCEGEPMRDVLAEYRAERQRAAA